MITYPESADVPTAVRDFSTPADAADIDRAVEALEQHGITVVRVADAAAARRVVLDLIPDGAVVHRGASQTLDVTGIGTELEHATRFTTVGSRTRALDRRTQGDDIRRLSAAPDVMLGSVAALTETGSLVAASMSGSQLGPYVSGAGRVVLVVGSQKVVADLEEALRRIEEHVLPLEDARARAAYGVSTSLNKLLVINREVVPGRITVVLVAEALGY
jgi:hypothetical protein